MQSQPRPRPQGPKPPKPGTPVGYTGRTVVTVPLAACFFLGGAVGLDRLTFGAICGYAVLAHFARGVRALAGIVLRRPG